MKLIKFIATAGFLAAALTQQVSAQTAHIYITGSSAFRSAAIAAIGTVTHLGNTTNVNGIVAGGGTGNDTTYTNATPPAGQATNGTQNTSFIWQGGFITNADSSTTSVVVCATFTGSETGVCTAMGSLAIPFLPDGSVGTANASCYLDAQGATPNLTTTSYLDGNGVSHNGVYPTTIQFVPNFAFSDVFQATTPFNGTVRIGKPFNASPTNHVFTAGVDNHVGFVTFKWVASANFPLGTGSTNVTQPGGFGSGLRVSSLNVEPNSLKALFSSGDIPLSQITGNSADQKSLIYATGRNPDSGTRATALADSGYGTSNTVKQYQPTTVTGGNVTAMQLYPAETIAGISTGVAGNSGEATGGTLRAFMADTLATSGLPNESNPPYTAAYFVTYLGTADAAHSGVAGIATELSYKGVPFSLAGIYQGQYTFWSIEHVYDRGDLSGAQAQTEANVISTLGSTPTSGLSQAGISNADIYNPSTNPGGLFQASRSTDGGPIAVTFVP